MDQVPKQLVGYVCFLLIICCRCFRNVSSTYLQLVPISKGGFTVGRNESINYLWEDYNHFYSTLVTTSF